MSVIDFDLKCSRCGAGLKGVTLDGACPGCGLVVGGTLHLPAIDPATMTVCADVPCRGCEYNLRTLSLGSVCPECGSVVAPSLTPIALVFADPHWLREQFRLVTITLIGLLMLLLPAFLGLSLPILGQPALIAMLVIVVVVFAIPTIIMGTWALCLNAKDGRCPRHVRLLSTIYPVLLVSALFLLLFAPMLAVLEATRGAVGTAGGIVSLGASLCCMVGLFLCDALSIRYMGRRAQSRSLCVLAIAWAACLVALMAFVLAGSLVLANFVGVTSPLPYPWERPVEAVIAATAIAAYVLGLATIVACRHVLADAIRRQDNDTPASEQDGTEGHREKGEASCR